MDRWTRAVAAQLAAYAEKDAAHKSLLRQCNGSEVGYLEVVGRLPKADREKVEAYICLCEELIWREVQLAYSLGTDMQPPV